MESYYNITMKFKFYALMLLLIIPIEVSAKVEEASKEQLMNDADSLFNSGEYEKANTNYINVYVEDGDAIAKAQIDKCYQCMDLIKTAMTGFIKGNYVEAIKSYEEVLKINPDDKEVQQQIVACRKHLDGPISEIQSNLTLNELPGWFDKHTMKAIPLSDNEVLIVYNKLMTSNLWDPAMDKLLKIPGIIGEWSRSISQKSFNAMAKSGLYIPREGLLADIGASSSITWSQKVIINGKLVEKQEKRSDCGERYYFYLISSTGKKRYDGGKYLEKEKTTDSNDYSEKWDTHNYPSFSFYPNRVIKKENGIWTIYINSK